MSTLIDQSPSASRRAVYAILIVTSGGLILGRIMALDAVDRTAIQSRTLAEIARDEAAVKAEEKALAQEEKSLRSTRQGTELEARLAELEKKRQAVAEKNKLLELRRAEAAAMRRPFLSANDRSRWCTVRALVEPEMRIPGAPYAIDKVVLEPGWDTIDMVKHDRRYSGPDKDPYKRIPDPKDAEKARVIGWDGQQVGGHLYSSKPPLLPTLIAAKYWLVYKLTGMTLGTHPFVVGRLLIVTTNLIPLLIAWWLLARLVDRLGLTDWGRLFTMTAACFATFLSTFAITLNNHLVAAVSAAVALFAAATIWLDDDRRLRWFVLAGLFGAFTAANELPALSLLVLLGFGLLVKSPRQTLVAFVPAAALVAGGFFVTNWIAHRSLVPAYLKRGGQENWYNFKWIRWTSPENKLKRIGFEDLGYWERLEREKQEDRRRMAEDPNYQPRWHIDKNEPQWTVYAFNVLVGHRGIFSLTPVWLLSMAGLAMWLFQRRDAGLRDLALLIALPTVACLAFYLLSYKTYGNYGGMSSGLRWMFWFAPLWSVAMLPAADAMSHRRWSRCLALLLLAISALSVAYPVWNPWTPPWLYDLAQYAGWVQ